VDLIRLRRDHQLGALLDGWLEQVLETYGDWLLAWISLRHLWRLQSKAPAEPVIGIGSAIKSVLIFSGLF
jgi:hypothetical protein